MAKTIKTSASEEAMQTFDEAAYLEERVPVKAGSESDMTVTLNGVNYRIKAGQTVSIPRKAALIIEQAAEQDTAAAELLERLGKRG